MHRLQVLAASVLALLVLAVACDGATPVDPPAGEELSDDVMAGIVMQANALTHGLLDDELEVVERSADDSAGGTSTTENTFSRTHACPAGGQVLLEGSLLRVFDHDTRVMEISFSGTRTLDECAFPREDLTITVNGTASIEIFRRRVEGRPDGPQTTTLAGSLHAVRSDGEERVCEFRLEIVKDPDTETRTLTGSICGRGQVLAVHD